MDPIDRLLAIEEIKRLKAQYCRAIDENRLEGWRQVFTEDAIAIGPEVEDMPQVDGLETMIAFAQTALEGAIRNHHIHGPEIELLSATEARAVWAMEDNLFWPEERENMFGARRHFRGFGHYEDKYRKTSEGWRITETMLRRTYLERDGEAITS